MAIVILALIFLLFWRWSHGPSFLEARLTQAAIQFLAWYEGLAPRRVMISYYAAVLLGCLAYLTTPVQNRMGPMDAGLWSTCVFLTVLSVVFFVLCCNLVLRHNTRNSDIGPMEVLFHILLGIAGCIILYAVIYRVIGVQGPFWDHAWLPQFRFVYFSAVTFSTLGYGDFSPSPSSSSFAALQAILGNLHLALFVGALFGVNLKERDG